MLSETKFVVSELSFETALEFFALFAEQDTDKISIAVRRATEIILFIITLSSLKFILFQYRTYPRIFLRTQYHLHGSNVLRSIADLCLLQDDWVYRQNFVYMTAVFFRN